MRLHWKVLAWMLAGVLVGLGVQLGTEGRAWAGTAWEAGDGALVLTRSGGPAARAGLERGFVAREAVLHRGLREKEERVPLAVPEDFAAAVARSRVGDLIWLVPPRGEPRAVALGLDEASTRARILAPFAFVADLFLALLEMLIVPLVFTSIVAGVAGVGSGRDLGRLGGKTFAYYVASSLLAILLGQTLVNVIRPGAGAELGLSPLAESGVVPDAGFLDVLKRMIPSNVFTSLGSNRDMLQIIFFALLFGFFATRVPEPHGSRVRDLFESLFQVVLRLAEGVLKLIPYGVFALLAEIVGQTGFDVFRPLLLYMATVTAALLLHAGLTLPLLLRLVGGLSPRRWFQAMTPALVTAFSTSSSSMTLPVTMETVEKRGRVSNKITSFTLPLGATINMDGTALYECIGVIFLAQYYAGADPTYTLTLGDQATVVLLALLASIGAAGIPSAGLVMMLTILSALGLPLEGAALLLAVDRPLDMLRTVVNVWSDTCGAAVVARSEGEEGPLAAGEGEPRPA